MYFIQKLVGLQKDNFQVSTLFTCLFNAMGIYPLIFLALLQPSGKSDNKVSIVYESSFCCRRIGNRICLPFKASNRVFDLLHVMTE